LNGKEKYGVVKVKLIGNLISPFGKSDWFLGVGEKAGQLQFIEEICCQYQVGDILLVYVIKRNNFVYLLSKGQV
jgi:hypothetical protein